MTSKVLWGEGLLLRPQHFQRQDQYHEHCLHKGIRAVHPYAWGVDKLEVDRDALGNGVLRILALSLRFQDGQLIEAPGPDALPGTVDLGQLQAAQSVTYYAAVPGLKPFSGNFVQPGQTDNTARFMQVNEETPDLYTQASPVQLAYLKTTARLVSEFEPRDAYVHFPLLRLRRAATGGFELDAAFVPPLLSIGASPVLFLQLRRLLDALQAKVGALYGHQREPSRNVVEFRSGDMSSFWLLHTASAGYAELSHFFQHRELHPERLFAALLSLAGGLMTYSRSVKLEDLPSYVHADPGPQFARLDGILRELLDTVISSRYFAIALRHERSSYYQGRLDSGKIDAHTTLYLAVSADMPALQLVEVVPLQFKVGAPQDVDKFVLSALPGVRLVHAPQVPPALPVRPDTYYFVLENRGALYDAMLKSQAISIYVPNEGSGKGNGRGGEIRDLHLELMAVAA